jgi:hypothetical protein
MFLDSRSVYDIELVATILISKLLKHFLLSYTISFKDDIDVYFNSSVDME